MGVFPSIYSCLLTAFVYYGPEGNPELGAMGRRFRDNGGGWKLYNVSIVGVTLQLQRSVNINGMPDVGMRNSPCHHHQPASEHNNTPSQQERSSCHVSLHADTVTLIGEKSEGISMP